MENKLENLLIEWPLSTIKDVDLATIYFEDEGKRYAAVNRALKKGSLIRLRRGLYLIGKRFSRKAASNFEIAHSIYGPSYISFESALFYHKWIPEAVYITTCATSKRSKEFDTTLGLFQFIHVPEQLCYLGVQRVNDFFLADPWKAIADHYYAHHREWNKVTDLCQDMRIEMEDMLQSDLIILKILAEHYQSSRVRKFLKNVLKELTNGNEVN